MRVLVDVSAVPRAPVGAGIYILRLVEALSRLDVLDLHLAARRDDIERWRALAPLAQVHAEVPTSRPARLVWEQRRAPGLAAELAVDVWHGPHYTLPLRAETARVVTVHDLTFFDHPEWHERAKVAFFGRVIPAALGRADAVITVSAFTAGRLRSRFPALVGDDARPVIVAPHGVDSARFHPGPDAADDGLLASAGVTRPYIGFVGLIEPRKNVPALIEAFSTISPARPELRLVLAGGDGWGTAAVRDAIATSGVTSRILRAGRVSDAMVPALLRNAEVVAYPSWEEGFGLPALEALACGAPLVSTHGSAIEEVVDDAGVLVAPGDSAALAEALEWLLGDESARSVFSREGPARAAEFTWRESARQHVKAYDLARVRAGAKR